MMNTTDKKICIVVVNGASEESHNTTAAGLNRFANVRVRHPEEITQSDIIDSDLVLIDHEMNNGSQREALGCISTKPRTGGSLAAILREWVDESDAPEHVTAFAVQTSNLDSIRGNLPSSTAQHVIAQRNCLEWVFSKDEPRRFEQMIILAEAMKELQFNWPATNGDSLEKLMSVLGLQDDSELTDLCWDRIRDYHPPVIEFSTGKHQIQLVRWLLHQVMPYPSFLWNQHRVAAELQVSVQEFRRVMSGDSQLAKDLNSLRYSGLLSGFLGERWWRSAIWHYLWDLAPNSYSNGQLRSALNELAGEKLNSKTPYPAMVCLDQFLQPKERFFSTAEVVRLQLDHWPALANSPRIEINDVKNNPDLLAIVNPLNLRSLDVDHR